MNVGWIGLGKLGLPCALTLAQHHQIVGYDVSEKPWRILAGEEPLSREEGLDRLITMPISTRPADIQIGERTQLWRVDSIAGVLDLANVVFVAVPTPHAPGYGGEEPMPPERMDFDYSALVSVVREVADIAADRGQEVTLVIVSTVLPGTINRVIRPQLHLSETVRLVYSPQFIAMGTTVHDFTHPEFIVCGVDRVAHADLLGDVLRLVIPDVDDKLFICDVTTAEAIKMFYNTFISMKIVWANHVMELCDKTGADCDVVVGALARATDRVISRKYLRGGMGDGGACHPRDLIALSWLERQVDASFPLFEALVSAREQQTQWLSRIVRTYVYLTSLPLTILGMAYKPGSDLVNGSPALLLARYLEDLHPVLMDSNVGVPALEEVEPRVFVIATQHEEYVTRKFWPGSVVIDPFGYIPSQDKVTVVKPGRRG